MKKRIKFFGVLFLMFPIVIFSSSIFGWGQTMYKVLFYSYVVIFMCYWVWNASYIFRGNMVLAKKIKSKMKKQGKDD